MFAVIRTGGKQYKVATDDVVVVEKLAGEPGAVIELGDVLMVAGDGKVAAGTPLLAGAKVAATVVAQRRGKKIIVFKKERRKNYRRKRGHRQEETVLRIGEIALERAAAPRSRRRAAAAKPAAAAEPAAAEEGSTDGA